MLTVVFVVFCAQWGRRCTGPALLLTEGQNHVVVWTFVDKGNRKSVFPISSDARKKADGHIIINFVHSSPYGVARSIPRSYNNT